jgi:hypothetical protein
MRNDLFDKITGQALEYFPNMPVNELRFRIRTRDSPEASNPRIIPTVTRKTRVHGFDSLPRPWSLSSGH